jgi:thiol-disulfide isomerase/thioredoxin
MRIAARRALLAGAGTLVGGSVATLLLLRKPPPVLELGPTAPEAPALQDVAALAPEVPARPMPAIGFGDAAGATHSLREFLGKGVVLNVWATWCAPCVAEMPSLATLAGKLAASGVVVLPLSIDRGGAAAVQAFYAAHRIAGLGVWTDPDGQAERSLGVDGVPTTFVVDRRGRQVALLQGGTDWGSDAAAAAVRALV